MDPSQLPKGQSSEHSAVRNLPGVYEMQRPGMEPARIITQPGDEGVIQADAAVRIGFARVSDLPSREELVAMQKKQQARDLAEEKARKIREEAELEALQNEILEEAKADAEALKPKKQ